MNAKTLEAVRNHGLSLLAAFPDSTERDPVALCRKLRRIEAVAHRAATDYCNGTPCHAVTGRTFNFGANETDWDDFTDIIRGRVLKLLFGTSKNPNAITPLFVNGDARGYALKLTDTWTRKHNETAEIRIHTDWGGYGILAPELD